MGSFLVRHSLHLVPLDMLVSFRLLLLLPIGLLLETAKEVLVQVPQNFKGLILLFGTWHLLLLNTLRLYLACIYLDASHVCLQRGQSLCWLVHLDIVSPGELYRSQVGV